MSKTAETLWHVPGCFGAVSLVLPSHLLRCVVFHNVSPRRSSPFTDGIRVSVTPEEFDVSLRFITTHFTPVGLEEIIASDQGRSLPKRPVLLTFDDAYASVAEYAADSCKRFKVPAVFFVNAAFLDNRRLAPDNLVCYVFNVLGREIISAAARAVPRYRGPELQTLTDVFHLFFPSISLSERDTFLEALRELSGIDEQDLADGAKIYLTKSQLRTLANSEFEIGNHTYTHPYCRALTQGDFASEIDQNKRELESITQQRVRSFSVPYGSSKDLTGDLKRHLRGSGYRAVFFSESVANPRNANLFGLNRVSTCATDDKELFCDLELYPRLRALRNRFLRRTEKSVEDQIQPLISASETTALNESIESCK